MTSTEISSNVNTNSRPSQLKITDMRLTQTRTGGPILKLDTNQGIYGLGEVRDGASKTYALLLKSRILGENPCNVDKIFRQIKQFGAPCTSRRRYMRNRDGTDGSRR